MCVCVCVCVCVCFFLLFSCFWVDGEDDWENLKYKGE